MAVHGYLPTHISRTAQVSAINASHTRRLVQLQPWMRGAVSLPGLQATLQPLASPLRLGYSPSPKANCHRLSSAERLGPVEIESRGRVTDTWYFRVSFRMRNPG
jgi:hypothetical protein